jgi:hypothetical protein
MGKVFLQAGLKKKKKKKGSQTLSIKITFVHRVYDSQMYFQ